VVGTAVEHSPPSGCCRICGPSLPGFASVIAKYRDLLRLIPGVELKPLRQQRLHHQPHLILRIERGVAVRFRLNVKAIRRHPVGQLRAHSRPLVARNLIREENIVDQRQSTRRKPPARLGVNVTRTHWEIGVKLVLRGIQLHRSDFKRRPHRRLLRRAETAKQQKHSNSR
jgi:hypothetical protein